MKTPWDSVESPEMEKKEHAKGKAMPFAQRMKALKGKLGKKSPKFGKS